MSFFRRLLALLFFFLSFILPGHGQNEDSRGLIREKGASSSAMTGKKYALIIGVSSYSYEKQKLHKLDYAHTDALNFEKLLRTGYMGKFEQIKLLLENEATYSSITEAVFTWLSNLTEEIKPHDAIYIYFSGHGIVTASGQNLLPIDAKIVDGNLAPLQRSFLLSHIRDVVKPLVVRENAAKVFYVIDACRENDSLSRNTLTSGKLSAMIIDPGEYFLYAASDDQFSYETIQLDKGNGLFTYFMVLGLQGAADINPADNKISLGELKEFVEDNVEAYSTKKMKRDPLQAPYISFVNVSGKNSLFLATLPKDTVEKYKKIYAQLAQSFKIASLLPDHRDMTDFLVSRGISTNNEIVEDLHSSAEPFERAINVPADTIGNVLYTNFLKAIENKNLVEPAGSSAYEYYLQLEKKYSKSELLKTATGKLFAAAIAKTQDVIDEYLEGTLANRSKKTFDLAYRELSVAKSLIKQNNPYNKVLQPKLFFISARALAGSSNPQDWDRGLRIIDSALASDPEAGYSYYTKAILFASKHRYSSAVKNFIKAIQHAPGWTYALYNLAETYYELSENAKSIDICRQVLRKDAHYADAYALIAKNFENVKMYDSAIYYNRMAISTDSSNVYAYNNLGRTYLKYPGQNTENKKLALTQFRIAAYMYADPAAMTMMGNYYFDQRQYDSAGYYYLLALDNNPFYLKAIEEYVKLLFQKGYREKADSVYADAILRMGNDSRVYASFVSTKFRQGAKAKADSLFNYLVSINHEDPSNFINYSGQLANDGQLEKAKAVLHHGLSYIPNSPSLLYTLAELYFKNRKKEEWKGYALDSSLFYFHRVRTITPEHSFTYFGLYQVYIAMGNIDSAFANLDRARSNNIYIESITNFNPDYIIVGDRALSRKDYESAIKYYTLARQKSNDFEKNRKLALAYFLAGNLETGMGITDSLKKFNMTSTQTVLYKQLKAHILFEQKKYAQAAELFREIDEANPIPSYLEQAVCFYMLSAFQKSADLVSRGKKNDPLAANKFIENEGIRYSKTFTDVIKMLK